MSVKSSPSDKEKEKGYSNEEDDDDQLWYLHTPEYLDDPAEYSVSREFSARSVLIPALLLCQTGLSLCNVICSFAIMKSQNAYERREFGFVSKIWLGISAVNTILPILMLMLFRMESPHIARIYCAVSCGTFVLLNISIIQALIVLVGYYWTSPEENTETRLTIGGILLGILARIIDIIVTGMAVFVVYEYSQLLDAREHRRRRTRKRAKQPRNKVTAHRKSSSRSSSQSKK